MIPTNLDLDTLRTLVVAHDLGGHGQAALRLGRTPSAVSLQMKRLQDDVGVRLFRKHGRTLALTEVGEVVLDYSRRMLELNDELLQKARGASLAGSVRIGFSQDFADTVLPDVLSRFSTFYPLVRAEVRIDRNGALVAGVETQQLDLALALGHAERGTAHLLGELPLVWIAGRGFVRRREDPLPLVMFEAQCLFRQRAIGALDGAGIPWRLAAVSPSLAGLWGAAVAGLGVTARSHLGVPATLAWETALLGLPALGSVPVTLHRRTGRQAAPVERLAEILADMAGRHIPADHAARPRGLYSAVGPRPARPRRHG